MDGRGERGEQRPLPPIRFRELAAALLERIDTLVASWLSGGKKEGPEWKCGSLAGGEGRSCSVRLSGDKAGYWSDFNTEESGKDLLSLYGAIHNLTAGKAALQVAEELGLEEVAGIVRQRPAAASGAAPAANPRPPAPAKPKPEREGWSTVRPVPEIAPRPRFVHQYRKPEDLQNKAEYRDGEDLLGYVLRYGTSDGGKDTLPYTFAKSDRDGTLAWKWRTWDEPRPLYLPGGTRPGLRTVVIVEGEVKAQALQQLLDAFMPNVYCVVSWPGGCKVWAKADWSWLAGCDVLLWPDADSHREGATRAELKACETDEERARLRASKPLLGAADQPGMKAQLGIARVLRELGCDVKLLPIPQPGEKPSGWDCKDAIQGEGWDGPRVVAFFGQAQAIPEDSAPPPAEKKRDPHVGTGGGDDAPGGGDDGEDDGDTPWWLQPYWDAEKSRWMVSRKLVIAALQHDAKLCEVLGYNELTNTVQCRAAWPWKYAKAGEVRSADSLLLGKYLSDSYGLPSIPKAALEEAIQTVAYMRRWHPVRDWLIGLEWDGRPRLDKWLIHVLGGRPDTLRPLLAEYLTLVGRYWLLGMVNRVMEPGCKFDYMPVLEGEGGLRKSTLVEVLAGSPFYSDTSFEVGRGKEGQEQVQGLWLYEIAELAHFSKADVGAIKAFVSSKVDRYRVAYGSTVESFPRQCLMVGTTNEDTYLRDRSGNRRFWPIPVLYIINTEWVAKWREQLFAEAFALYQQGARYSPLKDEEDRLFRRMQESRLVETAVESELLMVLTREPAAHGSASVVNSLADFVTIAQLTTALGVDAAKTTPGLQTQITSWLKHEGWERRKRQINGVRAWGYERPPRWPQEGGAAVGLDQDDGTPAEPGTAPQPPAEPGNASDGMDAPF